MVDKLNPESLTRESAIQRAQDEVVLNAAYINGDWVTIEALATDSVVMSSNNIGSDNANEHALYDPNSGELIATTRLCTSAHVEQAVEAADEAFVGWSQTTVTERARYLNAIAESMEQQFDKLVGLSVLNNGKPIEEAKIDVGDAIACYRYYANLITDQATWSKV